MNESWCDIVDTSSSEEDNAAKEQLANKILEMDICNCHLKWYQDINNIVIFKCVVWTTVQTILQKLKYTNVFKDAPIYYK
jgi:hypothetical protein